jgi:carnitine-CoA ligase
MTDWVAEEQDTVVRGFQRAVERAPSNIYLQFAGRSYTYGETHAEISRYAAGLKDVGVRPGETVTLMLDNSPDAIFLWYAAVCLGAIVVPINTALKATFLEHILNDAKSSVLIGESDYIRRLGGISENLLHLKRVFYRGEQGDEALGFRADSLGNLRQESSELSWVDARPTDVACLIYTGGTTGPSKGCMMSHNCLVRTAEQQISAVAKQPEEIAWNCSPLFHASLINTGIVGPALQGSTSYIVPRFSVSEFWPSIKASRADVAFLTGTMPLLIAQMPDMDDLLACRGQLRALHAVPVPAETERIWIERFGVEIAGCKGYGLTEAHLVVDLPGGKDGKPGSSGRRNKEFDVRIFDDYEKELPPGQVGEVVIRPLKPNRMFEGYWCRPQDTLNVMKNLWFHTGDFGMFDDEGWFFFMDRKKDYLRRRGENISSYEVERAVRQHPDVEEVAAHAVFASIGEDDLKLTVVLRTGSLLREKELFQWAIAKLPYFALPRYIEFRGELPKSPIGRILKYELRAQGKTETTWDREDNNVSFERR